MTTLQKLITFVIFATSGSVLSQNIPQPTDLSQLDLTVRHRVRAVYFTPSDRPFPEDIHQRLDSLIRLTRRFYREEMASWGYLDSSGRGKTFVIDQGEDGLWDVVFIVGEHPTSVYQNDPGGSWALCRLEMFNRVPEEYRNSNVTMLFYDTYELSGDSFIHTINGGYGEPPESEGTGYVIQGTHFLGPGFDTVALDPADQADIFLQTESSGVVEWTWDSQWRELTRGEFASTYVGVPVHEIGHAFYLDHILTDTDGDGVENNVMGNGFRRFGGRYGMPGPDAAPTILAPESAARLDTAVMFNQPDPFDVSDVSHWAVWR